MAFYIPHLPHFLTICDFRISGGKAGKKQRTRVGKRPLCEEGTEGSAADFQGFQNTKASAPFLRCRAMPRLQVRYLAKKVHDRTAHFCDTTTVLFGEPDRQGRGRSLL